MRNTQRSHNTQQYSGKRKRKKSGKQIWNAGCTRARVQIVFCPAACHHNCTLHTAHCTLHTANTANTAHCTLHTAHWTLHTANCKLHTAHCTLLHAITLHTACHHSLPTNPIPPTPCKSIPSCPNTNRHKYKLHHCSQLQNCAKVSISAQIQIQTHIHHSSY